MEEAVEEIANEMSGGLSESDTSSKLTQQAIRIATIALTSFRGDLLDRALAISKAVVEFDIELTHTSKEQT